jgi:hypothetical protein
MNVPFRWYVCFFSPYVVIVLLDLSMVLSKLLLFMIFNCKIFDGKFIIFWLVFTPIEIKNLKNREIHISLLMAIKFAIIFQNEILSILHKYI